MQFDFTIIGGAVVDIPVQPATSKLLEQEIVPVEHTGIAIGGDALNESTILSRLGKRVNLITKLGDDLAGTVLLDHCARHGIGTEQVKIQPGLPTSVNVLMIQENGERNIVVDPTSSRDKLKLEDIDTAAFSNAPILSFASFFISHSLLPGDMAELFRRAKEQGCLICADMMVPQHGETLDDLTDALQYVDYFLPSIEEACELSGETDPDKIADVFFDYSGAGFALHSEAFSLARFSQASRSSSSSKL